ncbi:unnamed protein product [Microthlaspi erraticum]|uniref:Uncharacterized protein n=1 Tax=Microthlaspi erraticum TaxID=1685480 RepID=A0A6D2KTT1_9BRAS|nr:unnamed protein product [Microthlaspi erraticum]
MPIHVKLTTTHTPLKLSLKNKERKPKIQFTGFVAMTISLLSDATGAAVLCIMLWLLCAWVFKNVTLDFHMTKYHEKIQDSLFFWYITEALSGRPWIEIQHLVDPEKASAWSMKKMLQKGLALKLQSESEARILGKKLFLNVARPGSEYIELSDLAGFLPENDALATLGIFDGVIEGETTPISRIALQHLMVYAFRLEKSLVLSMTDTDYIISHLRLIVYLFAGIGLAISLLVALVLRGCGCGYGCMVLMPCLAMVLARHQKLHFFNDSMQFVLFLLPFHVGERCEIQGDEFVVQKINFFSTIFVRPDDKGNVRFSNAALMHKNFATFGDSSRLEKMELILR